MTAVVCFYFKLILYLINTESSFTELNEKDNTNSEEFRPRRSVSWVGVFFLSPFYYTPIAKSVIRIAKCITTIHISSVCLCICCFTVYCFFSFINSPSNWVFRNYSDNPWTTNAVLSARRRIYRIYNIFKILLLFFVVDFCYPYQTDYDGLYTAATPAERLVSGKVIYSNGIKFRYTDLVYFFSVVCMAYFLYFRRQTLCVID